MIHHLMPVRVVSPDGDVLLLELDADTPCNLESIRAKIQQHIRFDPLGSSFFHSGRLVTLSITFPDTESELMLTHISYALYPKKTFARSDYSLGLDFAPFRDQASPADFSDPQIPTYVRAPVPDARGARRGRRGTGR
jgi:hypothetical protein